MCIFSILIIFFSQTIIFAAEKPVYSYIESALESAEFVKNDLGLSNIDFSQIKTGNPIYAYDYVDNKLEKTREYYPLFIEDELIAFAIQIQPNSIEWFEISSNLAKKIKDLFSTNDSVALIYDYTSCYLCRNGELIFLESNTNKQEERMCLSQGVSLQNIEMTKLKASTSHVVVVYGINSISGYLSVMDPSSGCHGATATTSGYSFVSGNTTLTFNCAACTYWTV